MATAQETSQKTETLEQLDERTIDSFLTHVELFSKSLEEHPETKLEDRVIEGIQGKTMLRLLQFFAAQNWKDLDIDPSIIDLDIDQFLKELVPKLKSKKGVLTKSATPLRTLEEIVEGYKQHEAATDTAAKKEHKDHIASLHNSIDEATKNARKRIEAELVAKQLETTEELTNNLTTDIDAAKNLITNRIIDDTSDTGLLAQLDSLLPQDQKEEAKRFLAEQLAEGIQVELTGDITSGKIKKGVLTTLGASETGRKLVPVLEANAQSFDQLANVLSQQQDAAVLVKAAHASNQVHLIFKEVGGEKRLSAFADYSHKQIGIEAFEELTKLLGISSANKDQITVLRSITGDLQKTIAQELAQHGRIANLSQTLGTFIGNHPGFYLVSQSTSISAAAGAIEKRSGRTIKLYESAHRLGRLRYPKEHASENISLLSQVTKASFPNGLLVKSPTSFLAGFGLGDEERLLYLLTFDSQLLSQMERTNPLFFRELQNFKDRLQKDPAYATRLRNYWNRTNLSNLLGNLSSDNPRFQAYLKNLIHLSSREYYQRFFNQRVFGIQSRSYMQSSFAYLSSSLTNGLRPRFFGQGLLFKDGKFGMASRFGSGMGKFLSGLKLGSKAIPGLGWAMLAASALDYARKHWKVVGAAVTAGIYGLAQLFGSLAQAIAVAGHAAAGALIGGIIGSIIPGLGTGVGALIGGVIGGFIGYNGGLGAMFSALGGAVNGFFGGLQLAASGVAGAATGIFGAIATGGILATSALIAVAGLIFGSLFTIIITPFQPSNGGVLDYAIPIRNTGVTVTNPDEAKRIVLSEFPSAQLQYWDTIVSQSIQNNWNPAFVLTLWIEETGASHHTKTSMGGGNATPVTNGHLGCAPKEDQTINESLGCLFRNFDTYTNDQFETFMRRYSGEQATGPFVTNPNFPARVKKYYSLLVPNGIIAVTPVTFSPVTGPAGRVFYCQGDPRWGDNSASCGLGQAGCAPSSLAIALSSLGTILTPPQVDAIFRQRGWRNVNGDCFSRTPAALQSTWLKDELGFISTPICIGNCGRDLLSQMQSYLSQGYIIIGSSLHYPCANCRLSRFAAGGVFFVNHVFVVEGINADGTINVIDPNNCDYGTGQELEKGKRVNASSFEWYYAYALKKR